MIQNVATRKILDIDWNFACSNEYSGDGAPVLLWYEAHGGNNQRFYFASVVDGKRGYVMIGRSADLEDGFDKCKTFLNKEGKMLKGSIENASSDITWNVFRKEQLPSILGYSWVSLMDGNFSSLGCKDDGDEVLVSLIEHEYELIIGKLHESRREGPVCYIPYNGEELKITNTFRYKVLRIHPEYDYQWIHKDDIDMESQKLV